MPTYLVSNRAPQDFKGSPESFQAWTKWFEELDDHLVDRGNPVFTAESVGNCGPNTVLAGFTLIEAASLNEAVALVETHPLMSRGGGVEVGEVTILNESKHVGDGVYGW